jgi:hypothetical protein
VSTLLISGSGLAAKPVPCLAQRLCPHIAGQVHLYNKSASQGANASQHQVNAVQRMHLEAKPPFMRG